ncbi:MAG TPA: hypothetical protein VJC04_03160 [Candidatus Paceibacterota bacterium]
MNTQVLSKSKSLAEIFKYIGQVFFASMFVGPIVTKTTNASLFSAGLVLSIGFWYVSLLLVKE